jgi:putative membrane protein
MAKMPRGKNMSSMSSVAGLSKFIKTLPDTKYSIIGMMIISFLIGSLYYAIDLTPNQGIIEDFIYGGLFGFIVLGITSIMSGALNQQVISGLNGINLKIKHSMFLSALSMTILGIFVLLGCIISRLINVDIFINSMIFACVLIYGFNTLVFWATSKVRFSIAAMTGFIQPVLIIAMYISISFLFIDTSFLGPAIFQISLKAFVASIIFVIAIYAFITVIASPFKKNLGIGVLDLLSLFIAHMNEGSNSLEGLFENMSEAIDTIVTFVSFKTENGIKALFISPSVHPGPLGDLGGSNMPTLLANKFDFFTMVAHGPSTHDFNPIAVSEIDKIENSIKKGLERIEYSESASKFVRYNCEKANIGVQFFNEGMVILSTFAPEAVDDIEFGVGLTMMAQSRNHCNVKDSVIVDCHNSFTAESGEVLPGNSEVFQLIDVIDAINPEQEKYDIRVGCHADNMDDLDKNDGVGESGIKTMIVEVDGQRTAYVLFDANNMEKGFRQEIIDAVSDLEIDEIEVMTTDTHTVNTISRGYNPIGIVKRAEIIEYTRASIIEAIKDLEKVEVGTGTNKIKNLNTFGPKNSTELISTISSVVAVSKIIAPVLLITSLFIAFVWIFFGGL